MPSTFLFQATFVNWGLEHAWWLAAGVSSIITWIYIGRRMVSERHQQQLGLVMSLIPVVVWATANVHMFTAPEPIRFDMVLPFHICYFLNLLMPVMLWRRSYFLFEISYFMVMAGCIQALLTPDIPQSFPQILNIRYFIVHIGLAQSILYAIWVFGFRPSWRSLGKSLLWSNVYFVFVAGLNVVLDTNFMYLCRKPPTPTLLDLFGDWPWYILGGEVLALALFTVVMLPFALRKPQVKA
ncbi:MAG: TIGR02206 family membrane protein [Saprospiraceae bacterium]|nr:TIGR02206 family membrane protein [Saprospiraceae bacterium]